MNIGRTPRRATDPSTRYQEAMDSVSPPADPSDPLANLAALALEGDAGAADTLCRELQGPLYRLAMRLLQHPEDARDATQESLVLVITHLSTFRADSKLLTWAYSIALRHFLRSRRVRDRAQSRLVLEFRIRAGLLLTTPQGAASDAEAALEQRETCLGCTRAMLRCLTLDERAAIILAEILGADDALGARLCGVPDATYRKRLSRAREKLRPVLEELCGLTDEKNPCSCERQVRAKKLVGGKRPRSLTVVTDGEVVAAAERLGAVRSLGAVLAGPSAIAVPEDLWAQVKVRLSSVLGPTAINSHDEPRR
jgi:RNA polymerase sigma factor (sigma-70 family)